MGNRSQIKTAEFVRTPSGLALNLIIDRPYQVERQVINAHGTVYALLTRSGDWSVTRVKRGRRKGSDGDRPRSD